MCVCVCARACVCSEHVFQENCQNKLLDTLCRSSCHDGRVGRRENAPPTDVISDKSVAAPSCLERFFFFFLNLSHSCKINLTSSVSENPPKGKA